MTMQKLIIRNFGPINHVELDVNDFMVFIGPMASGKSTLVKTIWFFKQIKNSHSAISRFFSDEQKGVVDSTSNTKTLASIFLGIFDKSYINEGFFMAYYFDEKYSLQVACKNNQLNFTSSSEFSDHLISEALSEFDTAQKQFRSFVHVARSLEQQSEYFWEPNNTDTSFYRLAVKLATQILGGKYQFDLNGEKILQRISQSMPDHAVSSGQQEMLWMLHGILWLISIEQPTSLFIEEPESHLFPETQKKLVDLITLFFGANNNQAFITTHSPYILTSLNNLLYAWRVGQNNPEAVAILVPQTMWLEPQRLSAYFVEDGGIRDIFDRYEEMIKAEEIDNASRIINATFDQLLNLEQEA